MAHVDEEIASQPECWQRALELTPRHLPEPGERAAVIGCGTSLYIAQAYAALRESLGLGETDAFAASEFPADRRYDRVVALTCSGTTTEVLDALARVGTTETVAVTADPRTPVGAAARHLVALEFADEKSVVQTRFATTALALLRAHLGAAPADLPAQARAALDAPLPRGALEARQFTFLGAGWSCGVAPGRPASRRRPLRRRRWRGGGAGWKGRGGPAGGRRRGAQGWSGGLDGGEPVAADDPAAPAHDGDRVVTRGVDHDEVGEAPDRVMRSVTVRASSVSAMSSVMRSRACACSKRHESKQLYAGIPGRRPEQPGNGRGRAHSRRSSARAELHSVHAQS